ncbi:MAG: putative lipid II flippase FtsW [Clostridia bacterium]|nr:putative lipid II flippase FtsW [Clostridia bacterium]
MKSKSSRKPMDLPLLIITLVLVALGLIAVLSASAPFALTMYDDSYYFFNRQFLFAIAGVVIMFVISLIDYKKYKKIATLGLIVGILLILAVFIPGLGVTRNDATRWLDIGIIKQFQPSELTKIALIVFLAGILSQPKYGELIKNRFWFFLALLGIVAVIGGILLLQPHMSAAIIIAIIALAIMFAAGLKVRYILALVPVAVAGIGALIISAPYRLDRLKYWLDPWLDLQGDGWQLAQSLMAVGSGGIFGSGIGQSIQKYMYLPEQYNDFIFAVWCEECGLIGAILLIVLFIIFIYRGIVIASTCKDKFGSYIAIGITTMIGIQALFNIAVVTGTIPVTGMSLPFFSYGGSSLLVLLASTGILLNISRNCERS